MLVIGLTGGIAAGKSTVCAMFAERGAVCLDSDRLAHEAMEPGRPAYQEIVQRFGPSVVGPDGVLNRRALGALVFRDDAARRELEAIIHPRVIEAVQERVAALRAAPEPPPLVVVEIPLLFEAGLEWLVDKTIVVAAEQGIQLQRLTSRSGLSPEEAMLRIKAQMPSGEKERRADFVIHTDMPLDAVRKQVDCIWQALAA